MSKNKTQSLAGKIKKNQYKNLFRIEIRSETTGL